MNLFHRAGRGMAKWRSRAMLVDPHKTKINLAPASKPRRLPPWVYRNLKHQARMKMRSSRRIV